MTYMSVMDMVCFKHAMHQPNNVKFDITSAIAADCSIKQLMQYPANKIYARFLLHVET